MASKWAALMRTPSAVVQLTRTQAASLAGDAFLTVALAKSLLFNVSAGAARPKVLLYLVITMVPFAVLAPVVGPLVDRLHRGRRAVVAATCFGRGILCLMMAGQLNSILLYPEAFGALMLGKGYAVANKALVPTLMEDPEALVGVNSRLAIIGLVGGTVAAPVAAGISKLGGSPWVLRTALLVYIGAGILALRLPKPEGERFRKGSGLAVADPAGADGRLFDGEPYFAELTGPRRKPGDRGAGEGGLFERFERFGRFGRSGGFGRRGPERISDEILLLLSASAMAILRGAVGFLTFLAIFVLKTDRSSLFLYGLVLVSGVVGSFLGAVVAPKMRQWISEQTILTLSMALPLVVCLLDWWQFGKDGLSVVALALGVGAGAGRVAFDSLVQRNAPEEARGRAFARYETRFQLTWVGGAFLAVVIHFDTTFGMVILSAVLGGGGLAYWSGLRGRSRVRPPRRHSRSRRARPAEDPTPPRSAEDPTKPVWP